MTTPPPPAELLAAALEELIVAVGRGIGQAQAEMDRASIALQRDIDADPLLAQHGLQATWYQMPRTELEIKVALQFQGRQPTLPAATGPVLLQPGLATLAP